MAFVLQFLLMAAVLWIYMLGVGIPAGEWRFLAGEGHFGKVVLITGLVELITYKLYERQGGMAALGGSVGAMLSWFMLLMFLKIFLN